MRPEVDADRGRRNERVDMIVRPEVDADRGRRNETRGGHDCEASGGC